jgi:hypothetical protein
MEHIIRLVKVDLERNGFDYYPKSVRKLGDAAELFVVGRAGRKFIGIVQKGSEIALPSAEVDVQPDGEHISIHALTWKNYQALKKLIPIAPSPCDKKASLGTGDRLGLVSAAHLEADLDYPVFPVIAQQSPRELVRTKRTFQGVLTDAVMGVLEFGYTGKFGADADHIKDEEYLQQAAEAGYTMYTLDVSDCLQDPGLLSNVETAGLAPKLSQTARDIIDKLGGMEVVGTPCRISEEGLLKSAFVYEKSMEKVCRFNTIIKEYRSDFDIQVSIDEGSRDTTPEDHLFVAEYLHRSGIDFKSLAPKFPGEFQKGVDFMGDTARFEESLSIHSLLARKIGGYKLSLHSGSDKFSIYPAFTEATRGHFHVKTSGTSWLQSVKLIAAVNVPLFNELYRISLENLMESKTAYHVYITPDIFPATPPQGEEPAFFDTRDVRQLFHISYGVLLDNKGPEILNELHNNERKHYDLVAGHIRRHLKLLFD